MRVLLLIAACGACVLPVAGCADGHAGEGLAVADDVEPIIHPQVHVLAGAPGVDYAVEADRITGSVARSPDLAARVPGDVIVSEAGLLRRVRGVSRAGDALTVTTDPADVTDVFDQVHVRGTVAPPASGSPYVPAMGQVHTDSISLWLPTIGFGGQTLELGSGSSIQLVDGQLSFQPSVDFDLSMKAGHIDHVKVAASGTANSFVHLRYAFAKPLRPTSGLFVRLSNGTTLAELPAYNAIFWAGWVPIVVSVRMRLLAGWDVNVGGDMTGEQTVSLSGSTTVGLEYDGAWHDLSSNDMTFSHEGTNTISSHAADGDMTLTARLDVSFYEVAGPYVGLQTYAGIRNEGDPSGSTWFTEMGMRGIAGAQVSILDKALVGYEATLFDLHEQTPIP